MRPQSLDRAPAGACRQEREKWQSEEGRRVRARTAGERLGNGRGWVCRAGFRRASGPRASMLARPASRPAPAPVGKASSFGAPSAQRVSLAGPDSGSGPRPVGTVGARGFGAAALKGSNEGPANPEGARLTGPPVLSVGSRATILELVGGAQVALMEGATLGPCGRAILVPQAAEGPAVGGFCQPAVAAFAASSEAALAAPRFPPCPLRIFFQYPVDRI